MSLQPTAIQRIMSPMAEAHGITRGVAVVAYPEAQILDVVGPLEAFAIASRIHAVLRPGRAPAYAVEVLAERSGPFACSSGLALVAGRSWRHVRGGLDTLLVAGGSGTAQAMASRPLLAWLRRIAPQVRRIGSVCSGAFVLGEAGLLDGRRATTHWGSCAQLAQRYPRTRSSCAMGTSTPPPGSPPAWTWPWR
jgi:transcriptional regulator GlxA family with amidase domain